MKIEMFGDYCLRDGLDYTVRILVTGAKQILALVEHKETQRVSEIAYTPEGNYLSSNGRLHALDLIDRKDWNEQIQSRAPRLLRRDKTYTDCSGSKPSTIYKVIEFGIGVDDCVVVAAFSQNSQPRKPIKKFYDSKVAPCDGFYEAHNRSNHSLKEIESKPCQTWFPGDPLIVRSNVGINIPPDQQWKRAAFVRYDEALKQVIVSTHNAPNCWMGGMLPLTCFPAEWVRLPTPDDVLLYCSAWDEEAVVELKKTIERMALSFSTNLKTTFGEDNDQT